MKCRHTADEIRACLDGRCKPVPSLAARRIRQLRREGYDLDVEPVAELGASAEDAANGALVAEPVDVDVRSDAKRSVLERANQQAQTALANCFLCGGALYVQHELCGVFERTRRTRACRERPVRVQVQVREGRQCEPEIVPRTGPDPNDPVSAELQLVDALDPGEHDRAQDRHISRKALW